MRRYFMFCDPIRKVAAFYNQQSHMLSTQVDELAHKYGFAEGAITKSSDGLKIMLAGLIDPGKHTPLDRFNSFLSNDKRIYVPNAGEEDTAILEEFKAIKPLDLTGLIRESEIALTPQTDLNLFRSRSGEPMLVTNNNLFMPNPAKLVELTQAEYFASFYS